MTIDCWILDAAARTPEGPALEFGSETLTYSRLAAEVRERARNLASAGIGRGDRVAWYGLNHPEVFVLLFACARIGAMLVPVNWRLSDSEVADIIANCKPGLVIHDRNLHDRAQALPNMRVVASDGTYPLGPNRDIETAGDDDPVLLVFTSGSTGRPKGVVHTQRALTCNAAMSVEAHGLTPGDRVLNVLPLFHVGGLNILPTPAFSIGATVVLHERFDPDATCAALREVTHAITVPTVLQAVVGSAGWKTAELGRLRVISIGSTDVPVPLIEAVQARGVPVVQIYGATETCPFAIYQRADEAMETTGSIGRVGSRCDVRLVLDGRDVPDGETGEIWVRGDNVLLEYWRDPELTAEMVCDGWFRTGDVARRDGAGLYWFTDRIKHVVISGGENIYPAEIERVLRDVPGIAEVAVVGRRDLKWGEVPVAVVVASGEMEAEDVLAPLRGRLARYKHPKDVVFVDGLPRNAMGKVVAADVRAMLDGRRSGAAAVAVDPNISGADAAIGFEVDARDQDRSC